MQLMLFKQEILLTYLQYIKLNVGDYTKKNYSWLYMRVTLATKMESWNDMHYQSCLTNGNLVIVWLSISVSTSNVTT